MAAAWTGVSWKETSSCHEIKGYTTRPETILSYEAMFQKPKLGMFGHNCTIHGQLKFLPADGESAPVNWFQGISVYLSSIPDTRLDWSQGMDQEIALHDCITLKNDGSFVIEFDLRETNRDPTLGQEFQIGVSLATHTSIDSKETSQEIVWESSDPAISGTIQRIDIPASRQIATELRIIDLASQWPWADTDGNRLVRAVNALQPLGKEKALAVLREYAIELDDYESDCEIVFWIVRLLFEPVDLKVRIPEPMIAVHLGLGNNDLERKENVKEWLHSPLEIVNGVPFMVGRRIGMGGLPEHPLSHIAWAEKHGVIRNSPLVPRENPLVAAEQLLASKKFQSLGSYSKEPAVQGIRRQAFSMVGLSNNSDEAFPKITDQEWKRKLNSKLRLSIWNPDKQRFVLPNQ